MITVLHVIDTGGPGGAETVFLNTVTALDKTCFRSICVVSREGWLAQALRDRGMQPLVVPAHGSFNLVYLRRLLAIVRKERVDVVAAHLFGSAIYCSMVALIAHIPAVSILHGQSDIMSRERFAALKMLIVRRGTDCLVFVSEKLKKELGTLLRAADTQCAVIPNGVDMANYSSEPDHSLRRQMHLPDDALLVGAIGNVRKPKSYDVLLRAAKILRDRSTRYRFVIAGEGSGKLYEDLLGLRASLGLEDAVIFLGLRSDVALVLRNLDVYALSSTTEGFSIACVEAMASGVPVVATRSGGPEEILEGDRVGVLVPTQDPSALAAAIAQLAENRATADEMAVRALERVRERYTLEAMIDAYQTLFSRLASTGKRR